jgi:hypothetical protein
VFSIAAIQPQGKCFGDLACRMTLLPPADAWSSLSRMLKADDM